MQESSIAQWWNSLTKEQRREWYKIAHLQGEDYYKNWDELDDLVQWSIIVSEYFGKEVAHDR